MQTYLKNQHFRNMGIMPQMLMLTFEAESVAYWVTQMIGLDTSDYSFGYISGWSKDKEVSELKESLDVIKQTADKLSSSIEEKIRELKKERESLPMVSEEKEPYIPTPHKKR